jgi:hypothetical protein
MRTYNTRIRAHGRYFISPLEESQRDPSTLGSMDYLPINFKLWPTTAAGRAVLLKKRGGECHNQMVATGIHLGFISWWFQP